LTAWVPAKLKTGKKMSADACHILPQTLKKVLS
jgi:hypothetical protein